MKTRWKLRPISSQAADLARDTGLSIVEAGLLVNRGIVERNAASSFLFPKLADLHDPMTLKDMDKAVAVIAEALERGESLTVYGDFDADGFTSTALLYNFFSSLGAPVSYYIPDRLAQGYGLHPEALEKIAGQSPGVVITVDCGTSDQDQIALAQSWGLKVVVTDHHQVPEDFRPCCPVVNPHRSVAHSPFKHLAGVGVAFFLAVALRAALREKGWFAHRPEPDLREYLDLVALGTVADMVPLVDQNRILVKSGLERIRHSRWPGIQALAEVAYFSMKTVSPSDLAFRLAPRLNASGRMGETEMGIIALTTRQPNLAKELAERLEIMNTERRAVERKIMEEIESTMLSAPSLRNRRTIVVAGKGWHRGVLGIIASRLTGRYHRPALVLNIDNGTAAGSGRSIPGFNLYKALTSLSHLLERYGGHEHAAGLALEASRIESLASGLESLARQEIQDEDLHPCIQVDAEISLSGIDLESTRRLLNLSPFGPGNPEPVFYAGQCKVLDSKTVGGRHLRMKVRQNGNTLDAIGFGLAGNPCSRGMAVNLIFTPEINPWQGRESARLRVIDLEPDGGTSKLIRPLHNHR